MSTSAPVLPAVQAPTPAVKILTFTIGEQGFGVALSKVREIVGFVDIAPIPNAPQHIKGQITLRGRPIQVLDIRAKLGLPHADASDLSCILVVETGAGDRASSVGLIVDCVTEVLTLAPGQTADGKTLLDPDQLLTDLTHSADSRKPATLAA